MVEVEATAPLVDTSTASLESVVNERDVQEIPLNGRHFTDLSQLTVGTVTGPAIGNLTVPLRGQGTFSFNSAGGREDTVNFMVNGINMNDSNNQQVTFQPTINTIDEFKIDNSDVQRGIRAELRHDRECRHPPWRGYLAWRGLRIPPQ